MGFGRSSVGLDISVVVVSGGGICSSDCRAMIMDVVRASNRERKVLKCAQLDRKNKKKDSP